MLILQKLVILLSFFSLVWIVYVLLYPNHVIKFIQVRNTADIEISQDIRVERSRNTNKAFPTKNENYSESKNIITRKHETDGYDRIENFDSMDYESERNAFVKALHDADIASQRFLANSDLSGRVKHGENLNWENTNVNKLDNALEEEEDDEEDRGKEEIGEQQIEEVENDTEAEIAELKKPIIELSQSEITEREAWIRKAKFSLLLSRQTNNELLKYIEANFNANSGPETGIDFIESYYSVSETIENPLRYKFIYNGHKICTNLDTPPWLIIMVLSVADKIKERNVIRKTWGRVARGKTWPGGSRTYDGIKIMFIFGKAANERDDQILEEERDTYGDIVQADFVDTYNNLTTKVMMGIKWTSRFCPGVKFLMKVDDDSFIHIPNAIKTLKRIRVPPEGAILGNVLWQSPVLRESKWGLSYELFPFEYYPPYTNGPGYAISGNILDKIIRAGEYFPYMFIEDAFLTGIVRVVIGAAITPLIGFPRATKLITLPCSFHNNVRVAATNITASAMREIWHSLYDDTIPDCYMCLQENC